MTVRHSVPLQWVLRQADERAGENREGLPLLSVSIATGVGRRPEDGQAASEDLSQYKVARPGQIVLNRMRAFQGAVGRAREAGLVSPDYTVITVTDGEPRFFEYLMRSHWFVGQMTASLRGIGDPTASNVRTPRINFADLGQLRIDVPALEAQRRIAGFLDSETARIDRLVSHVDRVQDLLGERLASAIHSEMSGLEAVRVRLDSLCDPARPIIYGIVLPGPSVEDGVPLIKGGDVHRGLPSGVTESKVARDIEQSRTRSRVAPGDLIYSIRGSFGDVVEVPESLPVANITQDVARIAPTEVSAGWLRFALLSADFRRQADEAARGAAVRGVNIEDLRSFRLPVPDRKIRERQESALLEQEEDVRGTLQLLRSQSDLLRERKQAIIAAAVTGQIAV